MKTFANKLNGNFLRDILPRADVEVDWVRAAIAYGSDSTTLLANCLEFGRRLDIWMRYDHTVPVSPQLLKSLLNNVGNNIFCYLVPDVLHSKIIWWKNYGIYVGSANLTGRAWATNIEFGMFISEIELERDDSIDEIEGFFDQLANLERSFPLTKEIVEEQDRISQLRSKGLRQTDKDARALRSVQEWGGPAFVAAPAAALDSRKSRFLTEWTSGLTILRNLADEAPNYRPSWLNDDVPYGWQADQFLHAYYYNRVADGLKHPFEEFHRENEANPAAATKAALQWWSRLSGPPSSEDHNCHVRAPIIRDLLSRERIKSLSLEDFVAVCQANHSTVDHARRMTLTDFGLDKSRFLTEDERVAVFANWLWNKKNARGKRIGEVLEFVFDGGPEAEVASRLFDAANDPDIRFPHFGTNQIAELAGWARPETYPPRNGRTSKSLRALGYDVRVY